MNKKDIVDKLVQNKGILKKDATVIVDEILDIIKQGLKDNDEVEFYGFMKFYTVHKDAYDKLNPKTKNMDHIDAQYVPRVKFSKSFRNELNKK